MKPRWQLIGADEAFSGPRDYRIMSMKSVLFERHSKALAIIDGALQPTSGEGA